MVFTLIYVSRTVDEVNFDFVQKISDDSIKRNLESNITGLLIWTEGYFCQLLQGEEVAIEATMNRIKRDSRHALPLVLLRTYLSEALFPDWSLDTQQGRDEQEEFLGQLHRSGHASYQEIDRLIGYMQWSRLLRGNGRHQQPDLQFYLFDSSSKERLALQVIMDVGSALIGDRPLLLFSKSQQESDWQVFSSSRFPESEVEILEKSFNSVLSNLPVGSVVQYDPVEFDGDALELKKYTCATARSICCENKSSEGNDSATQAVAGIVCVLCNRSEDSEWLKNFQLFITALENHISTQHAAVANDFLIHQARRKQFSYSSVHYGTIETVLNRAENAIIALDNTHRVLFCNRATHRLFGIDPGHCPVTWPTDLVFKNPVDLQGLSIAALFDQLKNNDDTPAVQTVLFEDPSTGRVYYLRLSVSRETQADSAIYTVAMFDDVTEQERMRERVRRSERLEVLGQLTSGIAHDFNNLLATVQNAVELARIDEISDQRDKFLDIALDGVKRGSQLTNRLVVFGAGIPMSVETRRVNEVLVSLKELLASSLEPDIHLVIQSTSPAVAVHCDASQLENALLNLVLNCKEAIRESGVGDSVCLRLSFPGNEDSHKDSGEAVNPAITVDADEHLHPSVPASLPRGAEHQWLEFRIYDNGPGMSCEQLRRAIDPFFTTRQQVAGVGLGLSMVHQFAEQSGGAFSIKNHTDRQGAISGVVSTIRLPMRMLEIPSIIRKPLPEHSNDSRYSLHNESILVVEDDAVLGELTCQLLRRHGYIVAHVATSQTAIIELKSTPFDLLLTDMVLPGDKDGIEVAENAKSLQGNIKVLYTTGYAKRKELLVQGPVLQKPVAPDVLLLTIQEVLSEAVSQ